MDELTLGLIGAGAVVVTGVVAYNAWQAAKVRRRMPRPMPDDAAPELARTPEANEERPFIEPAAPGARREPAFESSKGGEPTRREPSFGGVAPLDTPADIQAEGTGDDPLEDPPEGASNDQR